MLYTILTIYREQWRYLSSLQLLSYLCAYFMPSVHGIYFCVKSIKWPISHLDAFGVNLDSFVDVLQSTVPSISKIFAIGLRLSCPGEAKLFV